MITACGIGARIWTWEPQVMTGMYGKQVKKRSERLELSRMKLRRLGRLGSQKLPVVMALLTNLCLTRVCETQSVYIYWQLNPNKLFRNNRQSVIQAVTAASVCNFDCTTTWCIIARNAVYTLYARCNSLPEAIFRSKDQNG